MGNIEASAYSTAAEVLLIGLRHIKEHDFSHPMDTTPGEWHKIVDELIWFCEFVVGDKYTTTMTETKRFKRAQRLLGKHFTDIWC